MQRCQSVFIKRRRAICSPNNRYDVNHVNSVLVIYLFCFFSLFACDPVAVPCILKVSVPSPSSQMNKWNVPCANLCVRCMLSLSLSQYAKSSPVTVDACISNISLRYFFSLPSSSFAQPLSLFMSVMSGCANGNAQGEQQGHQWQWNANKCCVISTYALHCCVLCLRVHAEACKWALVCGCLHAVWNTCTVAVPV